MTNLTVGIYPYFSYNPSAHIAAVFAVFVYLSLIFCELILRATLTLEERNTKKLYRITATFLTISSQVLLASSFQCLVEMRGNMKSRPIDIVAAIIVPIGLIGSAVFLSVAKNFSFNPERLQLSFRLRQISVGIFFLYVILFFVFWHINITNFRRPYIKPLLIITCICLLFDATYVLATAIPSLFLSVSANEVWFYVGHLLPIFIALVSWSVLYWRKIPSRSDNINDKRENAKETLLPASTS
ncbi:unnamed protein product [Rotaria sp. Silwood1]|nr:unnamed protein product [Rotaria sp. Silwood1]